MPENHKITVVYDFKPEGLHLTAELALPNGKSRRILLIDAETMLVIGRQGIAMRVDDLVFDLIADNI